ncbi:YHR177W [Zygosaccharomyces parabailii]|nr:YHR177W [Zygosaccharomyces parabailii]
MDIGPTFKGYIEDENDALLVLQATVDGRLKHIPRRPYEVERRYLIVSGSIFVFVEEISGIKRWTDGVSWSPSRISGKFLMYKELDKGLSVPGNRKRGPVVSSPSSPKLKLSCLTPESSNTGNVGDGNGGGNGGESNGLAKSAGTGVPPASPSSGSSGNSSCHGSSCGASFSGSSGTSGTSGTSVASGSSSFFSSVHLPSKYTGFVKKTMSVKFKTGQMTAPETLHIVSYYSVEDVHAGRLMRPKDSPFFAETKPSTELLVAMENTSLGSHGKVYSGTTSSSGTSSDNSPLVPGVNGKLAFVDQQGANSSANINNNNNGIFNCTAGSMSDHQPPNYRAPETQPRQLLQPWQSLQPLPCLRIPSLTSMYKPHIHHEHRPISNHQHQHLGHISSELPPHSKFTRYGASAVPLLNPYLQNQFLVPQPPPNLRYHSYTGYSYYNPTGGAFYPLPAAGLATVASTATIAKAQVQSGKDEPPTSSMAPKTSSNDSADGMD